MSIFRLVHTTELATLHGPQPSNAWDAPYSCRLLSSEADLLASGQLGGNIDLFRPDRWLVANGALGLELLVDGRGRTRRHGRCS